MNKWNKEQREGLAKFCDTLAVSAVIATVVAVTGHSNLQAGEICGLIALSPILLAISYFLRSTK